MEGGGGAANKNVFATHWLLWNLMRGFQDYFFRGLGRKNYMKAGWGSNQGCASPQV